MKNHCLAALLCAVLAFAAVGCGGPRGGSAQNRRMVAPQTGTNIPRFAGDSTQTRDARSKQRAAKDRRETKKAKAEKPKREREERRRRAADEDVITRGGFR